MATDWQQLFERGAAFGARVIESREQIERVAGALMERHEDVGALAQRMAKAAVQHVGETVDAVAQAPVRVGVATVVGAAVGLPVGGPVGAAVGAAVGARVGAMLVPAAGDAGHINDDADDLAAADLEDDDSGPTKG
jgi:hypothetical protein